MTKLLPDGVTIKDIIDGKVVPLEPIPYSIQRVPITELEEAMCRACPLTHLDELADLDMPPVTLRPPEERDQTLEQARAHAAEDDAVFRRLMDISERE